MITRKEMELMSPNEELVTEATPIQVQRIKNYVQYIKKRNPESDFKVKNNNGVVTVTRIPRRSKSDLASQLRAMSPGDVIYPCDSREQNLLRSTARGISGEYKITVVMKVERLW